MKIILTTIMLFVGQQSLAVFPVGEGQRLSAELTKVYIGHNHLNKSTGGSLQIDLDQKVIQIFLNQRFSCPDQMVCAAVMPEDMVIEVPLIRQQTDSCGVVTYTAEVDNTIADGLRETIEVVDYQSATCMFVINTPTTIRYETFNPWTQTEETSNFDADFLRASAVIF